MKKTLSNDWITNFHKPGDVYMVESPTYYRAYQPILKRLQTLDIENLSFSEELVNLQSGSLPTFLEDVQEVTFDASIVYKEWKKEGEGDDLIPRDGDEQPIAFERGSMQILREIKRRKEQERLLIERKEKRQSSEQQAKKITLQQFFNTPHSTNSIFDSSQEKAVKECLRNRIGIIQGPPGCGKTFIGIQMLRLLLSLSSLKEPKILVLTYKNHALDEFLKGIMK